MTCWAWLGAAIALEIGSTLARRSSHGFARPGPAALLAVVAVAGLRFG